MRVVVHAGMHKTGTTAVQDRLVRTRFGDLDYATGPSPNHSGLFVLLFHEPVECFHLFRKQGLNRPALLRQREYWRERLIRQLKQTSAPTFVFSGEEFSTILTEEELQNFREFIQRHADFLEIYLYVRAPVAYMQSAFQQRVQHGLDRLQPETLWPHYRRRVEKLDKVFGRAAVNLRTYDPRRFVDGDVASDFAIWIGVEPPPSPPTRANDSLSLEATALLFTQRKLERRAVSEASSDMRANARFVAALRRIGTRKLRFAPRLVAPVIDAHHDDLEWIEARLGEQLLDDAAESGAMLRSEADLLAVAEQNRDQLERVLAEEIGADTDPGSAALVPRPKGSGSMHE